MPRRARVRIAGAIQSCSAHHNHMIEAFAEVGVIGDRDMHDASAVVGEDHEPERQAICGGWDHEEVGHHLADVVPEERPPRP